MLIEDSLYQRGLLSVCIRETLRDLKHSSKLLLEKKIAQFKPAGFRVFKDVIQTPGDGVIIFRGMQDYTAESIKSLEGFKRAFVEEAQIFSERSLTILRPTIREDGSEIWFAWNPRRKTDAVDKFLRQTPIANATVVKALWCDNPWLPETANDERKTDLEFFPDRYPHIWEGEYVKALEGAYFAKELAKARIENRICRLTKDPLLPVRAFWDIGGAGAKADAMAIWIVQWVKRDILVLDYIEGQGQVLSYYVEQLRKRGWGDAICYLPHDGVNTNNVTGKRYEDHLREAEFEVIVIPNQGTGAAMMRIEALRRLFPQMLFDAEKTEPGRDALGYYHEKKDPHRDVGLGPDHDWSSNCADAAGLMAICYEAPKTKISRASDRSRGDSGSNSWMAN